jgi:hypothetical protein
VPAVVEQIAEYLRVMSSVDLVPRWAVKASTIHRMALSWRVR